MLQTQNHIVFALSILYYANIQCQNQLPLDLEGNSKTYVEKYLGFGVYPIGVILK
jgi:hypothetical protein